MGENKKTSDKEVVVKEFVSRENGSSLKKRASKARYSYGKRTMGADVAELIANKCFLSLLAYAVVVIAVIIVSTMVFDIPVVAVCSIVVLETLLASCLHNLPVWLHGVVIIAEIVCGVIFDRLIFMIMEAALYLVAIFALKVIRK